MTIRFNDSLPVLVTTLRAAGIDVEAPSTVIVRDATGRLLVALTEQKATAELMADLSAALGAYAAPTPALDGSIAKRLAKDPSIRVMTLEIDDEVLDVRLIDRRVVGADWLRRSSAALALRTAPACIRLAERRRRTFDRAYRLRRRSRQTWLAGSGCRSRHRGAGPRLHTAAFGRRRPPHRFAPPVRRGGLPCRE